MENILIIVVVIALVLTKVYDVIATIKHVGARAETNPFAGPLMRRYGVARVSWGVFALVLVIALLAGYEGLSSESLVVKLCVVIFGGLVSFAQYSAGRFNSTGKGNFTTGFVLRLYSCLGRFRR